jgi:hypothetical protein
VVAGHLQVKMHSVHNAWGLSSQPWAVRHLPVPSARAASGASTCSSLPALASACWGSGGGRSGSVVSASGAGSSRADGSGAGVAAASFGLCLTALADLMKQSQLYHYKSKRAECSLCNKMQTYSEDFFMTAFFTLIARRVSIVIPIAGGGVTSAGGVVPATATVTAPVAEANGSIAIYSRPGSGEAGGVQMDTVSMQQYRYLMIQQGSIFILERLDFLRFPFARYPTTLRDRR